MALVNHNYGERDALTYRTRQGAGIDGADIKIFHKKDWDTGNRGARFIAGRVGTTAGGCWTCPVELATGDYVLVFSSPGKFGPDVKEIVVKD